MTSTVPTGWAGRIRIPTHTDLRWRFRDSAGAGAHLPEMPTVGFRWARGVEVDPFPCYPHDPYAVAAFARICELAFPIDEDQLPTWILPPFEGTVRMNGQTGFDYDYYSDVKPAPWMSYIVLWGKRVPPHPAVTRYLVGHEYGHVIEEVLKRGRGLDPSDETVLREYVERRGLDKHEDLNAAGGQWHRAPAEIFACDFRVLVAKIERDYWPHPGIQRPEALPRIRRWWRDQAHKARAAS